VNGDNSAPLYKFLKSGKWGIFGDDIQWNFAKFLVDKDGQVVDRYYPTTSPLNLEVYGAFFIYQYHMTLMVCVANVILLVSFIILQRNICKLLGVE